MTVLLASSCWIALIAGAAYQANHTLVTRPSVKERLVRRNPWLSTVLDEPSAIAIMRQVATRIADRRRAARRRLIAGLLTVVGAVVLINAPVATDQRRRHASGDGLALLPVGQLIDPPTPTPTPRVHGRHRLSAAAG